MELLSCLSWGRWDLALWPVVWSNKPSSWLMVASEHLKVGVWHQTRLLIMPCAGTNIQSTPDFALPFSAAQPALSSRTSVLSVLRAEQELEPHSPDSNLNTELSGVSCRVLLRVLRSKPGAVLDGPVVQSALCVVPLPTLHSSCTDLCLLMVFPCPCFRSA